MPTKLSTREMILIGLFSAIIIIQTYTPLGYFRFAVVDITLVHITVILATCLLGTKLGTFIGGVWGVTSWIYSFQTVGPLNPVFNNPMVSVAPRLVVGCLAGLTFAMMAKHQEPKISAIVSAAIGTLTNTTLVLTGFFVFGYQHIFGLLGENPSNQLGDPVLTFILSLIGTNTLLEILAAIIIVPNLLIPLERLIKKED